MSLRFPKEIQQEIISKISDIYPHEECQAMASILLEHLFGLNMTDLIVNKALEVSLQTSQEIQSICNRLNQAEPIQYVLGTAPFYGLDFYVNPNVLIPRQETESLIEIITDYQPWVTPSILDIGTGSGCIPCTLHHKIPTANIHALDISDKALEVAQKNCEDLGSQITLHKCDILNEGIPIKGLDIIVSNPPYVMNNEKALMQKNVLSHEPHLALFVSDEDPLLFYRVITEKSINVLNQKGYLFFEINEQFGREVALLMEQNRFSNIQIHDDIHGKNRFVSGEWHS